MSFPKYPSYKESGVEWIGDIPVGWKLAKLKHAGRLFGGAGFPHEFQGNVEGDLAFYKVGDLTHSQDNIHLSSAKNFINFPVANKLRAEIIPKKSILYAKIGAALLLNKRRINNYICCIDNNMTAFSPNGCFNYKFSYYWLSILDFSAFSNPGTVPSLSEGDQKVLPIVFPPLPEQQAIASFLDRECGKIDALIVEQERLIALLAEKRQAVISHAVTKGLNPNAPMKDSGIPWIGMVPEGWEVVRLGTIFEEVNESGNENLPILSVSIHTGVSDEELSDEKLDRKVTRSDDRSKYIAVRPGDLTYNMMRAWQGGFGAVQVMGMVSPAYVVARPKNISRQKTDFIELLLRTPNAISEMKRYSRGVTDFRLRLYWEEFKTICISLPTLKEQNEILNFLKEETGHFDALATTARDAITLLKERRAALISAAVTGKIDVRAQSKALAA